MSSYYENLKDKQKAFYIQDEYERMKDQKTSLTLVDNWQKTEDDDDFLFRSNKKEEASSSNAFATPAKENHDSFDSRTAGSDEKYLSSEQKAKRRRRPRKSKANKRISCCEILKMFPSIASDYIKLAVQVITILVCLYIGYLFITTIYEDVNKKLMHDSKEIEIENHQCMKEYEKNHCMPLDRRPPELERFCTEKEKCMTRDPYNVARESKLMAYIAAEVVNGCFEALSWKTIAALSAMVWIVILSGCSFNCCKGKSKRKYSDEYYGNERISSSEYSMRSPLRNIGSERSNRLARPY